MKRIFTIALTTLVTAAMAEGYQVNLQSARQAGMAHTGTSQKLGAESMHFNPAALVFMNNSVDLSVGASGVISKVQYENDKGYKAATDNPISTPMSIYAGFTIFKDRLAAGLAVTTPYGSSLDWGKQWLGATTIQDISLRSFVFQPTVSVKIIEGLSFGAGLMVATGNFELSRALMGDAQFQSLGNNPALATYKPLINSIAGSVPVSATLGGDSKTRVGYNLGLFYQPCEKISIGLSYRSQIKMKVTAGDAQINYASSEIQALLKTLGNMVPSYAIPPMDQGTFAAELPLPSNLTLGVSYTPNDRWLVALDLQRVGWKAYDQLAVSFNEKALEIDDIVSPKNYKNTMIYRLGAQYSATERFDVRFGAYLDETPVRSNNYNPETPGANKMGLTCGFSFTPYKNLFIDFAFSFIKGFERNGSYTNPLNSQDVFAGKYKSTAYTPSLGIRYSF